MAQAKGKGKKDKDDSEQQGLLESHGGHAVTESVDGTLMASTQCLGFRKLVERDSLPAVCLRMPSAALGMQRVRS